MSDRMRPIPFGQLMDWIIGEYQTYGSIFGVSKLVRHAGGRTAAAPFRRAGWRPPSAPRPARTPSSPRT